MIFSLLRCAGHTMAEKRVYNKGKPKNKAGIVLCEGLPDGYPCEHCERMTCSSSCPSIWVYYADYMHKVRVAQGLETVEREAKYRVFRQRMIVMTSSKRWKNKVEEK